MFAQRAKARPRGPQVQTLTLPAPVGGLNARDALANMPPTDAVILDNFFPGTTGVELRRGNRPWSTGYPAAVESLMTYNGPATSKLFAAAGTSFYDATAAGPVGAAVVSGLANARWQHTNMGTPGGQFLYCVNGVDYPALYNGTVWQPVTGISTIAITGVDPRLLIHVNLYANRVFFVEKNSARVWYLPVNSVGGAALSLDLSPLLSLGGYLMAMATWTIDNADGVLEYAVFISSEGEVIMYSGTDPASPTDWKKNGRYRVGRPVGRRCFMRVGSDVVFLTSDGFIPLSKALLTDRSQTIAISDKITNLLSGDLDNYADNFGWDATLYPEGDKLLVNVPTSLKVGGAGGPPQVVESHQYVMNTITGAWCRYTNWNASVFESMRGSLYYGAALGTAANSAFVAICDDGFSDNGGYIFGEAKMAFQDFGIPGQIKQVTMGRMIIRTAGNLKPVLRIDMDFRDTYPAGNPTYSGSAGAPWDAVLWNTVPWGSGQTIKKEWQGLAGQGVFGAAHVRVVNNKTSTEWQSIEYVFRIGGTL